MLFFSFVFYFVIHLVLQLDTMFEHYFRFHYFFRKSDLHINGILRKHHHHPFLLIGLDLWWISMSYYLNQKHISSFNITYISICNCIVKKKTIENSFLYLIFLSLENSYTIHPSTDPLQHMNLCWLISQIYAWSLMWVIAIWIPSETSEAKAPCKKTHQNYGHCNEWIKEKPHWTKQTTKMWKMLKNNF